MKSFLILCLALAIAGCASMLGPNSVRVGESPDQVRTKFGPPASERKLPSGQNAWYYTTAPSGYFTWRAVFGADGRVSEYSQVLTSQNFYSFPTGASRDQVLDLLGPPEQRMSFERTHTESWTYRFMNGTFYWIANLTFGAGTRGLESVALNQDPAFTSPGR
jgi:outer membrane protein assembly factor BamE (lipoprotein component of BamABCDE complex)